MTSQEQSFFSKICTIVRRYKNSCEYPRRDAVSDLIRLAKDTLPLGESDMEQVRCAVATPDYACALLDTCLTLAQGYSRLSGSLSTGARLSSPAFELIKIEQMPERIDWKSKWQENGGKLSDGRIIALKTDPIWKAMSLFGFPFPPFDYCSGMGWKSVHFEVCEQYKIIESRWRPKPVTIEELTPDPIYSIQDDEWFLGLLLDLHDNLHNKRMECPNCGSRSWKTKQTAKERRCHSCNAQFE